MIRRANEKDLEGVKKLLEEVLNVHAGIRPDLFKANTRKYTDEELLNIFNDDTTPVFIYVEDDQVLGHVFLEFKDIKETNNMYASKTLYIDDLCVGADYRNKHIGSLLFDYVKEYAKKINCDYITLNVWEGNTSAIEFYKKRGFSTRKYSMEIKID